MKYLFTLLFYDGPIIIAYENDDETITVLDYYNDLGHWIKFNSTQELLLKYLTNNKFLFRNLICGQMCIVKYNSEGREEKLNDIDVSNLDTSYFYYGDFTNEITIPTEDPLINNWIERKKNELH